MDSGVVFDCGVVSDCAVTGTAPTVVRCANFSRILGSVSASDVSLRFMLLLGSQLLMNASRYSYSPVFGLMRTSSIFETE